MLSRFAYLQLRRRLLGRFEFRTATGTRCVVERNGDFSGVTHLFYQGFPDLQETAFACHALRSGEVFFDVGANQGFWSLLLAGRGIEAHAFEPTPITFANQAKQFSAQPPEYRRHLHGHNVAMGEAPGVMKFASDLGQANHLLAANESHTGSVAEVAVTTIDAEAKTVAPNLIKIDVEGWTIPVLRGASATLARPDLFGLIIETFRFADGDTAEMREVEKLLANFGFRPCSYDPRKRTLSELRSSKEGRQDTIYVRRDSRLHERLRSAVPISVFGEKM